MPYIDRDENNNIIGIFSLKQRDGQEFVDGDVQLHDSRTYQQKRAEEYPEIGDQLDAIMKWVAGENEIQITAELKSIAMECMAVKSKFPKPKE